MGARVWWFAMGERYSDSGDSTEKNHLEECRQAAAERTRHNGQGLAMKDKVRVRADAEARAKLFREVEVSDTDPRPEGIQASVAVTGHSESSCWRSLLLISTSPVWLHGSKGTKTLNDRRSVRAQDFGFEHGAPTADGTD